MASFYLGLSFRKLRSDFQKILNFKTRFDEQTQMHDNELQMPLLPPFQADLVKTLSMREHLADEVESYLSGDERDLRMKIVGTGVLSQRKHLLYLKVELPEDLKYCLEGISQLISDIDRDFKMKKKKNIYILPIARFYRQLDAQRAMEMALNHFHFPIHLEMHAIGLYQKTSALDSNQKHFWQEKFSVYEFANSPAEIENRLAGGYL